MSATYNIQELFELAFGIKSPAYSVPNNQNVSNSNLYQSVQVKPLPEANRLSWMGTPIMFPIQLKGGNYQKYDASGQLKRERLNDFELPPTTLVDFRRAKNITKTPVLGNNGTIKEIYGFDDWRIRMRGLCLDTPDQTAQEQIENLLKWEDIADSIEVSGELFLNKNIVAITIEEIDIKQVQGKTGVVPFEIVASSDEPLELVYL